MQTIFLSLTAVLIATLTPFGVSAVEADSQGLRERVAALVTEHITIASDTPGITLYIRNKRPQTLEVAPERTLLFVHGATYPAETSFDLELDAMSWMDYVAAQGWDVYLVDLRGYGQSSRPPEMDRPAQDNAPLWLRESPSQIGGSGPLGAYRTVTKEAAKKRWLNGVPEQKAGELIPPGWFAAWADATWATDPRSKDSGLLRAPNGVVHDVRNFWMQGKPLYDPGEIRALTRTLRTQRRGAEDAEEQQKRKLTTKAPRH